MRWFATLCLLLFALGSVPAPAYADVPDPEPEPKPDDGDGGGSDDDSACTVVGFGMDDAAGYAPVLLGVMLLGATRRRRE